jgi:hypothetical protein
MKKQSSVNIKGWFEPEVLRILRGIPGLSATVEPEGSDHGVDAVLQFAGTERPILLQLKSRANVATAWQVVHQAETGQDAPVLLVAGETTADARRILEQHGISVVDGLANAHIELPGLLFHREGHGSHTQARPTRLTGKAGVAAQALLLHPNRAWQVKDLAGEAGVSAGLAHRVLARLEAEGVAVAEGTGPSRVRRVTDPTALLDLWAEEDAPRPARSLGYLLAPSPQQLIEDLRRGLDDGRIAYALTGAAAANLVAPFVTAVPVIEVWISALTAPDEAYAATRSEAVTDGHNLVFLQAKDDTPLAFRERVGDAWLAGRFRLYADLRRDPRRGREQADHLRQEVIGFGCGSSGGTG